MTHRASRPMLRFAAAMLLVLTGVAGGARLGAHLGQEPAHRAEQTADHAEAVSAEGEMLQRLAAAYERTDRARRSPVQGDGEAGAEQGVSRAEGATARQPEPEPEPEPEPDPEPAPDPPAAVPVPASCDEYTDNRATGCALLLDAGFALDQMPCLDNLWTKESGWNHRAENPSSGAYGIPQALPGSKMSTSGDDWRTNPATQIRWGLNYIDNRYGTPCGAWSFFQANNWY